MDAIAPVKGAQMQTDDTIVLSGGCGRGLQGLGPRGGHGYIDPVRKRVGEKRGAPRMEARVRMRGTID